MFKYFHILNFLINNDLTFLKECWRTEIMFKKKFFWPNFLWKIFKDRLIRYRYLFLWRLANQMYLDGNNRQKKVAIKLNQKLIIKYNIELCLGAKIGKGLNLTHLSGIVITSYVSIGDDFTVKQNTTIGVKTFCGKDFDNNGYGIRIGNNVIIGANSCIISDNLSIGNNVTIGAMSFINKDIPDDCTVYTEKTNNVKIKAH